MVRFRKHAPAAGDADDGNSINALDADAVETLTIKGDTDLNIVAISAATAVLSKVDASQFTGDALTISVAAGSVAVEFIGSAGVDTYTATDQGDTLNTGAGADVVTLDSGFVAVDTIIVEAGDSVLNADADGHDVINNFGTAAGAGGLDIIDLGAFGFTGQQASALASKGALANSVVDGTTLTQADFFSSGGVDRGVAIGTNGGDTFVFIDVNKDGNFAATDDLVLQLVGVTDVGLGNFGF